MSPGVAELFGLTSRAEWDQWNVYNLGSFSAGESVCDLQTRAEMGRNDAYPVSYLAVQYLLGHTAGSLHSIAKFYDSWQLART